MYKVEPRRQEAYAIKNGHVWVLRTDNINRSENSGNYRL